MPEFDLDAALMTPEPPPRPVKVVAEYEVVDIGIENCQYFRGFGRGGFDDAFTGQGDTPGEALDCALNQAAESDWEVDGVVSPYTPEHETEWSVSARNRLEWEADLNPDDLEGLTGDERAAHIDDLWQEACDDGYGQDTYYYVGLRLRERTEDEP